MKYRSIDYSLFDDGKGKWSWKLHPKLVYGVWNEIIGGEADSRISALAMIRAAIDRMMCGRPV